MRKYPVSICNILHHKVKRCPSFNGRLAIATETESSMVMYVQLCILHLQCYQCRKTGRLHCKMSQRHGTRVKLDHRM